MRLLAGPGRGAPAGGPNLKAPQVRVDSPNTVDSTSQALSVLARRLAAFAGALTALVALLAHVPLRIACLRGAIALAAVLALAGVARFALERSLAADRLSGARKVQP